MYSVRTQSSQCLEGIRNEDIDACISCLDRESWPGVGYRRKAAEKLFKVSLEMHPNSSAAGLGISRGQLSVSHAGGVLAHDEYLKYLTQLLADRTHERPSEVRGRFFAWLAWLRLSGVTIGGEKLVQLHTFESCYLHLNVLLLLEGEFIPSYLIVTDCRMFFVILPSKPRRIQVFELPLLLFKSVSRHDEERGLPSTTLEIRCHNTWTFNVCVPDNALAGTVHRVLDHFTPARFSRDCYFAWKYFEHMRFTIEKVFSADILEAEYRRLVSRSPNPGKWRVSHANRGFRISATSPESFVTPAGVSDEDVAKLAGFRINNRFPIVSWIHPKNGACIVRASQPAVGLGNRRCSKDEEFMRCIASVRTPVVRKLECTENNDEDDDEQSFGVLVPHGGSMDDGAFLQTAVLDARPFKNAVANLAKGGGYISVSHYHKCRQVNANVGNIHRMTRSFNRLGDVATGRESTDEAGWFPKLHSTGWLLHIQRIMQVSVHLVHMIDRESTSVLVHCTNGWDRTSQICSLANLMMDPYYRTIEGFLVLLEKDWLAGGHKFGERVGALGSDHHRPKGVSPIFLQFAECVWHLLLQFPTSFEFSEEFLSYICTAPWDGRTGSFIVNTPKERHGAELCTVSLYEQVGRLLERCTEARLRKPRRAPRNAAVVSPAVSPLPPPPPPRRQASRRRSSTFDHISKLLKPHHKLDYPPRRKGVSEEEDDGEEEEEEEEEELEEEAGARGGGIPIPSHYSAPPVMGVSPKRGCGGHRVKRLDVGTWPADGPTLRTGGAEQVEEREGGGASPPSPPPSQYAPRAAVAAALVLLRWGGVRDEPVTLAEAALAQAFFNKSYKPDMRSLYPSTHPKDLPLWVSQHSSLEKTVRHCMKGCRPPRCGLERTTRFSPLDDDDDGGDSNASNETQSSSSQTPPYKGGASPPARWFPDRLATHCHSCRYLFTVTRRRHHCRRCGYVFCSACSSMRTVIGRVCRCCYNIILPQDG